MLKIIVNSTPIIALSAIDELHLLKDLYGEVIIPKAVFNEVVLKGNNRAGSNFTIKYDFINIQTITNENAKRYFETSLHEGEVEVMILAQEITADICIIDDYLARRYAKHLGLSITGTIGVLIKAKEKGLLKEITPLLNALISNGIYIDNKLFDTVVKLAKE